MKKRKGVAFGLALSALLLGLSGCTGREAGDMFALPEPPETYQNLNAKIGEVRSSIGGESIAPQSGANTQTVQLQDLDGDGEQESAVAFFRVPGAEKPLKIYIFRLQNDGESYELDTCIEGVGSSISSVAYENVGGTGRKEVVVSWQISANDHALGVYSLDDVQGIEMLWVDSYSRFRVADLDTDGEKELVVLTAQGGEEAVNRADYYDFDGAALALKSTAALSAGINEIKTVRTGRLVGGENAIFVTSGFSESTDQVVDILACEEGTLKNVTLNQTTLRSEETIRTYTAVAGTDIDRDGIMEIPQPTLLPKSMGATDDFWLLNWRQFDLSGKATTVMTTYHNVTDGWYFVIPDGWEGKITISRKDSTSAEERGVAFSLYRGEDKPAEPFMVLYKLTGTGQTARAGRTGRELLFTDSSATYACELLPDVFDTGLTAEDVKDRFHMIRTEWSIEN